MPSENLFTTLLPTKQAEIIRRTRDLHKSNPKGHGFALKEGLKRDENNNKWKPRAQWAWVEAGDREWRLHLEGIRFLGLGPNFDNATTYWGCIDVDQLDDVKYEMDFLKEMRKLKESGLSQFLVPDISKNGGFHLKVFFSEAISCATARRLLSICASLLGYAKNEIFPKQVGELVEKDDCPNWVFMPYGPTWDVYSEQNGMSDTGNALTIEEYLTECENKRMSPQQVEEFFHTHAERQKGNGSNHSRSSLPKGLFIEGMNENDIFKGGPPCLWVLAHKRVPEYQHNYLFNALIFVKKKFPDNYQEAIRHINQFILSPHGDSAKLDDLIKTSKDKNYTYKCKDAPICDYCDSHACRKQPYGVGSGEGRMDWELGMIVIDREPRMFIVNMGEKRVSLTAKELMSQKLFTEKCIDVGAPWPDKMKGDEWDRIIRIAVEDAQIVRPSEIMRTNADEYETLEKWLGIHIPNNVRRLGLLYLNGRGDKSDAVRIKVDERRIYIKFDKLKQWCFQTRTEKLAERVRNFVDREFTHHVQELGSGMRDWYRGTWSISFDKFDEAIIDRWLNPDKWDEREGEEE
jgi:hypothetical protein